MEFLNLEKSCNFIEDHAEQSIPTFEIPQVENV
jgi:uncharacterized membrane protein